MNINKKEVVEYKVRDKVLLSTKDLMLQMGKQRNKEVDGKICRAL